MGTESEREAAEEESKEKKLWEWKAAKGDN